MKSPTTLDNQISTSAIDLFASGMGAFMLIALVFMVMFAATPKKEVPDTPQSAMECPQVPECPECPEVAPCPQVPECPECPEVAPCPQAPECPECPEAEPCPECPELAPCPEIPEMPVPILPSIPEPAPTPEPAAPPQPEPQASAPTVPVQTTRLPDTDLVFMIDTTSSMRAEIDALKRELHIVVEILERLMPTVGIGVVTFNDRRQNPRTRHYPVRRLTGDEQAMREIQRFLRSISVNNAAGPNPDIPEAVLAALQDATRTSFRAEVKNRVIFVITDSYAYRDVEADTFRVAQAFAAVEGQRVCAVHIRQSRDSEKYLQRLAEAGGGQFVPDRGSILANLLAGLL